MDGQIDFDSKAYRAKKIAKDHKKVHPIVQEEATIRHQKCMDASAEVDLADTGHQNLAGRTWEKHEWRKQEFELEQIFRFEDKEAHWKNKRARTRRSTSKLVDEHK